MVFTFNTNYIISFADTPDKLEVKYYNFLDKIVHEEISKEDIVRVKKNKANSRLKIVFTDNRILTLIK